jgi:hypothetical protein
MRDRDRVFPLRVFFQFRFYPSCIHCMPLTSFGQCFRLFLVRGKPVVPKHTHVDIPFRTQQLLSSLQARLWLSALQSTTIFIKQYIFYQGIVLDEGKLWELDGK